MYCVFFMIDWVRFLFFGCSYGDGVVVMVYFIFFFCFNFIYICNGFLNLEILCLFLEKICEVVVNLLLFFD